MSASERLGRFFRIAGKMTRFLCYAYLIGVAFLLVNTFLHMKLHVCVLHLSHFERKELTPVMYGYPMDEAFEAAKRGEVVLGGCVRGPFAAVCPHCHWPAELVRDVPERIAWDDKALAGLSPSERQAADRFATLLLDQAKGQEEWWTAVCITSTDVWIGTFNSGLGRMDRKSGSGVVYRGKNIGECIYEIRSEGARVIVTHEFGATSRLCEQDATADRGQTWQRL